MFQEEQTAFAHENNERGAVGGGRGNEPRERRAKSNHTGP